jgi:hypothetical protein
LRRKLGKPAGAAHHLVESWLAFLGERCHHRDQRAENTRDEESEPERAGFAHQPTFVSIDSMLSIRSRHHDREKRRAEHPSGLRVRIACRNRTVRQTATAISGSWPRHNVFRSVLAISGRWSVHSGFSAKVRGRPHPPSRPTPRAGLPLRSFSPSRSTERTNYTARQLALCQYSRFPQTMLELGSYSRRRIAGSRLLRGSRIVTMSRDRQSCMTKTLAWVVEGNRVDPGPEPDSRHSRSRKSGPWRDGRGYCDPVSLNRPVALKVLRPDFLSSNFILTGSGREALAVAEAQSPEYVRLRDGESIRFITSRWVCRGDEPAGNIRKKGPWTCREAVSIMKQTGRASAAGRRGLIRATSSRNILITHLGSREGGGLRPLPRAGRGGVAPDPVGMTLGTPLYEPRAGSGGVVDRATSIRARRHYFMLAGVTPFQADSAVARP